MSPTRSSGPRRPVTLLQQAAEPIFLLEAGGRLLYVNPAWEALTGLASAEVVGRDFEGGGGEEIAEVVGRFRPPTEVVDGSPASAKVLIRRRDGEQDWRVLEFWPHRDREGRALFVLGLARPIGDAPIADEAVGLGLRADLWRVRQQIEQQLGGLALIGRGPAHRRLVAQVRTASSVDAPTLILGPAGTGKRQVARAIQRAEGRQDAAIQWIDCEAMPPEAIALRLFGGSTAGAMAPEGCLADSGTTVALRDLLALPRDLQSRLEAALATPSRGGARVLALASEDPIEAVRDGRLRPGLYYALSTIVIRLEPLRERLEELPILAQHFLERTRERGGPTRDGFRPEAVESLLRYDWPGNLRELARVVESAADRASGTLVGPEDLPASILGNLGAAYLPPSPKQEALPLDATLEHVERRLIERALRTTRGNKSTAAQLLQISRARLHRRIQDLGLTQS